MESLRILIAGNVNDGKSTLLGRLLFDSGMLPSDLRPDRSGKSVTEMDLAHITDGLKEEREHGITIDVAYKYFFSKKKKYILIDAPGHLKYTGKMFTGASNAQVMVLVVDVKKGLSDQTIRHLRIASLLKIERVIVCFNKMDLLNYSQKRYELLKEKLEKNHSELLRNVSHYLPLTALTGEGVVKQSKKMPWYKGLSLFNTLEQLQLKKPKLPTLLQVQSSKRMNYVDYHFCQLNSGDLKKDDLLVSYSKEKYRITKMFSAGRPVISALEGEALTLVFNKKPRLERGEFLAKSTQIFQLRSSIGASICCLWKKGIEEGGNYFLQNGSSVSEVRLNKVNFIVNNRNGKKVRGAKKIKMNEIADVKIVFNRPTAVFTAGQHFYSSKFILIDTGSGNTVAGGYFI